MASEHGSGPKAERARSEQIVLFPQVLRWLLLSTLVALLAGTASAGFLVSLDWATAWREAHVWIIACLPAGGFLIGLFYHYFGKSVEAGNNLILDEIHDPKRVIPLRMTPLVLLGTVASHFFGGSVGREGTAVQMGGSLADQLTRPFRLSDEDRRILLMAGVSAGFSSVFGTPLAGAVFGLEVLAIGKLRYDAIFPCFAASVIANYVTLAWGVHHTAYPALQIAFQSPAGFGYSILAGAVFGVVGMLFAKVTHGISAAFKKTFAYAPLRPLVGGALVALAVWMLGTRKYIGLGIPTIVESFQGKLPPWDFAGKFAFTALTLGAGYKGGEVTPLFFIGATLGNALSYFLPIPTEVLAAMGFVAVFAGAANTPIASTFMAIELFGPQVGVYAGLACVASYLFSGHAGIYGAQRIGRSKQGHPEVDQGAKLASLPRLIDLPPFDLVKGLHVSGFTFEKENPDMGELVSLRLYFHFGASLPADGFFGRLMSPPLGTYLAKQAKAHGIEQFILHRVSKGYIRHEPIASDISELPPDRLPMCAELVDQEEKLRSFLEANKAVLKDVRAVMLRLEEPLYDSAKAWTTEGKDSRKDDPDVIGKPRGE